MRYLLFLSYDGTSYAGWQKQPNALTVQGEIEIALFKLFREKISVNGCGRTDKGVHATNFAAHLNLPGVSDVSSLIYKLNSILPNDIACNKLVPVEENFHARFDALARSYTYKIHFEKSPFKGRFSTYLPKAASFNINDLNEVALIINDTIDFSSFCKAHTDVKTMICKIKVSEWKRNDLTNDLFYRITADRFLRGMVRLIVGSTINVASGKLSIAVLTNLIKSGQRNHFMSSAPAQGLLLSAIEYPESNEIRL